MKKVFNVIKSVFVWIVLVISVGMMIFTVVSVNTFDKNDRDIFGFKFFIVQTDSMKATHFDAGDVIISQEVDVSTLKEGDVITFVSDNPESAGEIITHRIRKVTTDASGSRAFVTYGTTTNTDDEALATMIIGQYRFKIPKVGLFFAFLKTIPGYIVCILVPFLILMLSQGVNCIRLFKRYRAEQMEGIQAEREQLETEREESRKMMEELMALKEQLAKKEAEAAAVASDIAPAAEVKTEAPDAEEPKTEETVTEAEKVEVGETTKE